MTNNSEDVLAALVALAEEALGKVKKAADRIEAAASKAETSAARAEHAVDTKAERVAVAGGERIERAATRLNEGAERITAQADTAERAYRRWPLWLTVSVIALGGLNGWLAWRNASIFGENSDLVRQNEALGKKFRDELALAVALQSSGSRMACDAVGECVITLGAKIQPTQKDGRVRLVLPARR